MTKKTKTKALASTDKYDASKIDKLEGLEAVRKRPGMFIGDPDEHGLHHTVFEVLDNSIDEHLAGFCDHIAVTIHVDGSISVRDDGRGIPVDTHPKFKIPAVELVLTNLHAGGKFGQGAYKYSGGLHGVGASVVNALSDSLVVQVARNKELFRQSFSRGLPQGPLEKVGGAPNRRGTSVAFTPDTAIFGEQKFKPARLYRLARSKAYLFAGVEIRWKCAPELISDDTPPEAVFQFPGGLADHLKEQVGDRECATSVFFSGNQDFPGDAGLLPKRPRVGGKFLGDVARDQGAVVGCKECVLDALQGRRLVGDRVGSDREKEGRQADDDAEDGDRGEEPGQPLAQGGRSHRSMPPWARMSRADASPVTLIESSPMIPKNLLS